MNATASENTIAAVAPTGNRPHVGAHQPADERHRQDRRDDGERRQDRRVADFVDGADGDRVNVPAIARHPHVPHDVLDDDDRVVHEDADREDQREERDAVQRVAVEIEDEAA